MHLSRTWTRIRRHWKWARSEGFGRLIEEDQLDPVARIRRAGEKRRWRRSHAVAPRAMPVFVLGLQRSGTNMIARGLEEAPEFEVRNENDRRAFVDFQLRPLPVIRSLVIGSGHRYVLFKPLCDSHRAIELLDGLDTPTPGRAIWAYRTLDDRVRSAVSKFGSANREALARIAAGDGSDMWQAGGLSAENRSLIEHFDYASMSAETAAALFWLVRNSLFFELGLDRRADVLLCSYDRIVSEPEAGMRRLCGFLDLEFRREFADHIEVRSAPDRPRLSIDPEIRSRCDELEARLNATLSA